MTISAGVFTSLCYVFACNQIVIGRVESELNDQKQLYSQDGSVGRVQFIWQP